MSDLIGKLIISVSDIKKYANVDMLYLCIDKHSDLYVEGRYDAYMNIINMLEKLISEEQSTETL